MAIRPEELAELVSIPVEAAQLILDPPPDVSEQQLRSRLQKLVPFTNEQRSWIWEVHKTAISFFTSGLPRSLPPRR